MDFSAQLDRIEQKLDQLAEQYSSLHARLSVLEARNGTKVEDLSQANHAMDLRLVRVEDQASRSLKGWQLVLDSAIKVAGVILAAALVAKLGLK